MGDYLSISCTFWVLYLVMASAGQLNANGCGGNLTAQAGSINSTNFPNMYPDVETCAWTITVAENQIITLRFHTFKVDTTDNVVFYDGDSMNSPVLNYGYQNGYWTESKLSNFRVRTTDRRLHIVFTANRAPSGPGFVASYWAHECPQFTFGLDYCDKNCSCIQPNTLYCNNTMGNCLCKPGWFSRMCEVDVDECINPNICQGLYSYCNNTPGSYSCDCKAGLDVTPNGTCSSTCHPQNNCSQACGVVSKNPYKEQCHCPKGMKLDPSNGQKCIACTNWTYGEDCKHTSSCIAANTMALDKENGLCHCYLNWTATYCNERADACRNGLCNATNSICEKSQENYKCRCTLGYEEVNELMCDACGKNLTQPHGIISSGYYPENGNINRIVCSWTIIVSVGHVIDLKFDSFTFNDRDGYVIVYDGLEDSSVMLGYFNGLTYHDGRVPKGFIRSSRHEMRIVRYSGSSSRNNFQVSYTSHVCNESFYGPTCSTPCNCYNNNTEYCDSITGQCLCRPEWTSPDCTGDKDECLVDSKSCPNYSDCTNLQPGYNCTCKEGLHLNNQDECVLNEKSSSACTRNCSHLCVHLNDSNTDRCYCPIGMTLDGDSCVYCVNGNFGPDCSLKCSCVENSTTSCEPETGTCLCLPGWTSGNCSEDIDECYFEIHKCKTHSTCTNTLGDYECICDTVNGFENVDNRTCKPIECNYTLTNSTGWIISPNFPFSYHNYATCYWLITVETGRIINVRFDTFSTERNYDIVTFYDGRDAYAKIIGAYSGELSNIPTDTRSNGNTMFIRFISDYAIPRSGFRAFYTSYYNVCTDFHYGLNCSTPCNCSKSNTHYCNRTTGQCICKPEWTSLDCTQDINECLVNPLACPNYSDCANLEPGHKCTCKEGLYSNNQDLCVLKETGLSNCTRNCSHVCVALNDSLTDHCYCPIGMTLVGDTCVSCRNGTFGPDCSLECKCVENNTDSCDPITGKCVCLPGWSSDSCSQDINECYHWNQCQTHSYCVNTFGSYDCACDKNMGLENFDHRTCRSIECNYTLANSTGWITSPNYPSYYYNYANCFWLITVDEGKVITVRFENFSTQRNRDFVTFYDGVDGRTRVIGKYSGELNDLPTMTRSNGNTMLINFISDYSTTERGFRASYTSSECKHNFYDYNCSRKCECIEDKTSYCDNNNGECVCKPGWKGKICADDVDECHGTNNQLCPANSQCTNSAGSYSCVCSQGYTHNATMNVCKENKGCLRICSHACSKENGTETCICPEGLTIDVSGSTCVVPYYPHGDEANDLTMSYEKNIRKINQESILMSSPISFNTPKPFGPVDQLHATAYVLSNGLIVFGDENIPGTPNLNYASKQNISLIAPFWSDINPISGHVNYHLYEKCSRNNFDETQISMTAPFRATVLSRAAQDLKKYYNLSSFEVDTVLVVTWVGVEPFKHFQQEKNTFQAVFISGWNGEYQNGHGLLKGEETSYVIFLYQKGQMNWTYKLGQPINVGFTGFALPDTDTLLVSMLDKINGNTGEQGVYTYLTGQSSGPIQACHRYICNNLALLSDPVYEYDKTDLFKCPCTMERLGHQWQLFQTRGENHDIQCYAISHLAKIRLRPNNKRNKLCCYKMGKPKHPEDWRDVEQTRREASYVPASGDSGHVLINEPWPEFYFNIDEVLENVEAHKICCADSTRELCGRFYQIFPDMGCTDFVVFVTASALGDPHITTLDGVTYTMNGWGEYILMDVKSKNFTLQARTGRVESLNGSADNATVFTAFAASEGGYAKFQVQLANNNRTMIVYVNGMDVTHDFNNDREFQMLLDKISVLREDSSNKTLVIATFPCGISIKVSVAVKSLDIELEIDKSLENKTLGLLGNFNHNQTDEFTLPNGTVLASKMSERELLYSFGRHWEVSAHNTIFAYGKGENSSTFSHPDFVPLFGDEVSPETTRVAEQTCGENNTECIIDYVVTGSQEFASSTMQSFLKQQSFVSNLANNPPELSLKNDSLNSLGQWNVTESKDWTLEVFPEDADGDVVSIELVGNHTGASVRNRSIIYTPDAKNPINLGIRAKDSKGAYSPIVYVTIAVCTGCNGHGACTLNTRNTDNSEGYFQVLQCSCFPAYTGSDCESELDACASKPCSVGQECTDLTAAQQGNNVTGYVCGPCPVGYSDYDKKCVDTNECTESNGLCQHNCTNTEGSFICSCRQGFRLDATNKKTCTDVNECEEQTSQCKHTCKNTEGSYNCSCYEGYDLKSDGYTCELTSNGKRECEHCQHTCLFNETTNTASCVCDKGYKPDPNNTNECLDINECELLNMPCSQSCNNTEGNFKCYCYTGFKLESDMVSCKACEIPSYGEDCAKTCQCNGRGSCNTVKGCVCDVNWTGVNCDIDVDECATQGSCPEGQLCLNTYGSFTCSCPTGYVFAGQVCNDTDECSNLQINVTCDLRKEVCINTVGSYWCDCKQGYARNNNSTCQDIDECALHIDGCQHMCHNVEGRFNCECDYGYILEDNRKSCTRIRDLCVGHQLNCTHGCSVDDTNKPYCICPRGYTRNRNVGQDTCIDINECTSPENNSCFYKTGCNNTDGGYTCSCPAGFKLENNRRNCLACPGNTWGPECSQDCACGIGAKRCDPTTGCVCLTGFQGKYCTDDIDECEIHNLTCPGKQQCVNTYGGAKCVCPSGFQYDTKQNCVDINECSSEHSCTQICTNTVGSYICSCNEGYIYNATTNTCLDIDECREGTHKCHEKCDNTEGSYRCSCQTGLFLQLDGVSCEVDIPCINTTSCSEKCANINGIETCLCGKGKVLATDKTSCDDLDLCKNTSCTEGCVETKGNTSFECLCNTGKYLAADGTTCSECVNGKYGLNCSKICSCETANTKSCNVVDGTCECQSGWKGNNCTFDEDECGNGSASCQIHSRCINTLGSFTCVCNDGFILRESICKECDDDFYGANCSSHCSCGAHSKCNKTDGACYCKLGWKGNNCDIDIDECRENIHNCSSSLLEVCSNTEGGYKCVCNAGYTKLCDSCECKDINECASAENNSCSYKPGCNNTDGGYTCSCSAGYKLDNNGRNCQECTANTYGLNCSQSCTCVMANTKACDTINGHCLCLSGWKGDRCESDVNECTEQSVSCRQNSHCVNTAGSFTCLCDIGFYDDTNGQCKALLSTHKVAAIITLDYNISNINFADQSSENYQRLAENIQNGLLESLKKFEPSVISLTVTKLSKGSLIVETEITMGTQNSTEKASEVVLGKALVEMMQNGNAIRIDSTPVVMSALTLNGGELSKSDGACDIQSKIEPCSASDVCEEVGKEAVCKHKIEKDSQNLIIGLSVGLSLFTILFVSIWIIFCCWVKQNKAKNRVENNEPLDLFKSQTDRKSTLSKQLSTHGGGDDQSQGTDDNTDGSSWRNSVLAYQSSNSRITRPKLLVSGSMQNTSSDTKYRGHQGSADINGSGNEMMTSYNL